MLLCKGYRVLALRHRTKAGEIDLIALKRKVLVIVEVKARRHAADALASVDEVKQRRLIGATKALLSERKFAGLARHHDLTMRFDVMAVQAWRWPLHMKNAFRPEE